MWVRYTGMSQSVCELVPQCGCHILGCLSLSGSWFHSVGATYWDVSVCLGVGSTVWVPHTGMSQSVWELAPQCGCRTLERSEAIRRTPYQSQKCVLNTVISTSRRRSPETSSGVGTALNRDRLQKGNVDKRTTLLGMRHSARTETLSGRVF